MLLKLKKKEKRILRCCFTVGHALGFGVAVLHGSKFTSPPAALRLEGQGYYRPNKGSEAELVLVQYLFNES